jgi:hypothetical protein
MLVWLAQKKTPVLTSVGVFFVYYVRLSAAMAFHAMRLLHPQHIKRDLLPRQLRGLYDLAGPEALVRLIESHGGDVVRIPVASAIRAEVHKEAIRKALLKGVHPRTVAWKYGIHIGSARRIRTQLLGLQHGQLCIEDTRESLARAPRKRPLHTPTSYVRHNSAA